jgi:hypothetical protein
MDLEADEIARARKSGAAAFAAPPVSRADLKIGNPERVHSPEGRFAYWLVPGQAGSQIQAIARVLPDGRIATIGELKSPATDCAQAVTGLSLSDALRLSKDLAARYPSAQISQPLLVHDGPVAREAWLHKVKSASGENLWVFATAGGTYARPAGNLPSQAR